MNHSPPKWLIRLLNLCCPDTRADDIKGDFLELYDQNINKNGRLKTNHKFILDSLSLVPLKLKTRTLSNYNSNIMVKNYFKIAYRNMMKDKAYAFINISGLAIGMACMFIILIYVNLELSFDKFHKKAAQIHRVQHVYSFIGAPIGPAMVEEYPEVIDCTRIYPWAAKRKTIINDEEFYEDYFLADNNFFKTFTFEFIHGDPKNALTGPESLVITESIAEKYFGSENPVGKILRVETLNHLPQTPLKVTGVIKDIPYNSQLQFTHVASFDLVMGNPNIKVKDSWINDWIITYLVLENGASPKRMEDEYWDFFEKHAGTRYPDPFRIMPLTDVRHDSGYLRSDFIEQGNINHIKIFSAVAILVLFIACVNYMNLSTAKSSQRAKEVGIRKVLGAVRKQLLTQFLFESIIISVISLLLGALIVVLTLPHIESLSGIHITEGLTDMNQLIVWAIAITLGTGIIAGSYPAVYLASFGVSDILKDSKNSSKRSVIIRKGLVIMQLSVSVALIVGTLVVLDQMDFIRRKDLGFKADQTLVLKYGRDALTKWDYLKTSIGEISGVVEVATTYSIPGENASVWRYRFEGDPEEGGGYPGYYVGPNALQLLELEVLRGRLFDEKIESDKEAFILTEKAWRQAVNQYGETWENPLGKTIAYSTTNSGDWQIEKTGEVIGVVKDFHARSLQMPLESLIIQQTPNTTDILVRFESSSVNEVTSALEQLWPKLGSKRPFNMKFLDQQYASYYESENRFSHLLYLFCGLAIFIACLGLYGLASFTAQRRVKEIGVRKVLGASVTEIFTMITSDFIRLVIISFVISFPIAWYLSNSWLDNFAYRIDISIVSFAVAASLTILLSVSTVSWQALKASTNNPVNSLRNE